MSRSNRPGIARAFMLPGRHSSSDDAREGWQPLCQMPAGVLEKCDPLACEGATILVGLLLLLPEKSGIFDGLWRWGLGPQSFGVKLFRESGPGGLQLLQLGEKRGFPFGQGRLAHGDFCTQHDVALGLEQLIGMCALALQFFALLVKARESGTRLLRQRIHFGPFRRRLAACQGKPARRRPPGGLQNRVELPQLGGQAVRFSVSRPDGVRSISRTKLIFPLFVLLSLDKQGSVRVAENVRGIAFDLGLHSARLVADLGAGFLRRSWPVRRRHEQRPEVRLPMTLPALIFGSVARLKSPCHHLGAKRGLSLSQEHGLVGGGNRFTGAGQANGQQPGAVGQFAQQVRPRIAAL